jgi:uncharacterized protein (DUF2252 family)
MMTRVVERIRTFNTDRDPALLKQKYQAMQTDAFAFLRGTCHLFYEDWPVGDTSLNETPPTWICGDLHLQNLGSYKGDNRLVYFSINDFDESVLAPCTWDLARLLTSLLVAAHTVEIKRTDALALCRVFLEVYTGALLRGRIQVVDEERAVGVVRKLLYQVEKRRRIDFLNARTTVTAQGRRLQINGKQTCAITEQERATVMSAIESLSTEPTARFLKVLDVAHRVAGVGSLGIDRYVVLVEGRGSPNQNYLLDVKATCPSSLQPYLKLKQPNWDCEAERSVTIRRWVQGIPPALLSDIVMNDQSYVVRELQPTEDKVNLEPLRGRIRRLDKLVRTIASVVAWGQLRSGGIRGSATVYDVRDFAKDDSWQKALLSYVKEYAHKVEQDYQEFAATMKDGA